MLKFLLATACSFILGSTAFAAQVVVGSDGIAVFRPEMRPIEYEMRLESGSSPYSARMPIENIRGVLVLNKYEYSGGDGWRTTVLLGTIDASNGQVRFFTNISVEATNGSVVFSSKTSSFPQLNPSLPNSRLEPAQRAEAFRRAISGALVQQTLSERGVDLQAVAANFIDRYEQWRTELPAADREIFDREVIHKFAAAGFSPLYRDGGPIQSSSMKILKIALESGELSRLPLDERIAAATLLDEMTNTESKDFFRKSAAEKLTQSQNELITALRKNFADLGPDGRPNPCNALGSGFKLNSSR